VGGAATGAFMTPVTGGDLGDNILSGAASGAVFAAMSAAMQHTIAVSQASADPEGGSGEQLAYKRAVGGAAGGGDAGSSSADVDATRARISAEIRRGNYDKAIAIAAKELGLRGATFDAKVEGEGVIDAKGNIKLGKDAFYFKGKVSASWLES